MTEAIQRSVTTAQHKSVCSTVITAIANAKGVEPRHLSERLNDVIDPDALDRIFGNTVMGRGRTVGRVLFEMAGCEIEVHATGHVCVTDLERGREAKGWVSPPSSNRSKERAELDG